MALPDCEIYRMIQGLALKGAYQRVISQACKVVDEHHRWSRFLMPCYRPEYFVITSQSPSQYTPFQHSSNSTESIQAFWLTIFSCPGFHISICASISLSSMTLSIMCPLYNRPSYLSSLALLHSILTVNAFTNHK